jgi:hypothetical protein
VKPRPLTLARVDDRICRVLTARGEHVGNLKRIAGVWKFKAIGHEADGQVVPGGGPLTHRHDMRFADLDEDALCAGLLGP